MLVSDHWVMSAGGRLFTRVWEPAASQASPRAPLVLLHDSLGCVELWRDFPAELAKATGRKVIAYDRLGFGRSQAQEGKAPLTFIQDEASTAFFAVKEALGLERFGLFGHSVGGEMAVYIAAQFALECVAVVSESAQAFVEEYTRAGVLQARKQFADPAQLARLRQYHGERAE